MLRNLHLLNLLSKGCAVSYTVLAATETSENGPVEISKVILQNGVNRAGVWVASSSRKSGMSLPPDSLHPPQDSFDVPDCSDTETDVGISAHAYAPLVRLSRVFEYRIARPGNSGKMLGAIGDSVEVGHGCGSLKPLAASRFSSGTFSPVYSPCNRITEIQGHWSLT